MAWDAKNREGSLKTPLSILSLGNSVVYFSLSELPAREAALGVGRLRLGRWGYILRCPAGASQLFLSSVRLYGCQSHLDSLFGTGFNEFCPLPLGIHIPNQAFGI